MDCLVRHSDDEELLISHDFFAIGQSQDELASSNWVPNGGGRYARLFLQLTHSSLCKGFTRLQPAARSRPVVLSLQCARFVREAKEQQASRRVENEQPGGRASLQDGSYEGWLKCPLLN